MRSEVKMALADFLQCISAGGTGNVCELAAGTYDIDTALIVGRSDIEIRGAVSEDKNVSVLRRAESASGELFTGALLRIVDVSNVVVRDLDIDGSRFGKSDEGRIDRRHPNEADPSSPRFTCATRLSPPDIYDPRTFVPNIEADVFLSRASRITISGVTFTHPVRNGLAIGDHTRDVTIDRVTIRAAGDFGVWAGFKAPDGATLPIADDMTRARPYNLRFGDCHIEDCGSAAFYLTAAAVSLRSCTLERNHRDYPYNAGGGQIEIDYKSDDITVESSAILDGLSVERIVLTPSTPSDQTATQPQLFKCVGIEANGSHLLFRNNRIEGNSHEGIRLNGARHVKICGESTMIANNHAIRKMGAVVRHDPIQNISITTTSDFARLNAIAGDIQIEDITCEHGILIWTNGSVKRLRIDDMKISGCIFPGASNDGLVVGRNPDGSSLRGDRWSGNIKLGRSTELPLDHYNSEKIECGYLERYDPVLEPWIGRSIILLEIGVHTGGSLVLWRDYFPLGTIVGIDIDLSCSVPPTERIHMYEGNQTDTAFLSRVAMEMAPEGFDIIIDDGAHLGEATKAAFWHLFDNHLKSGGLYAIEDWGTSYWDDWPDGKSFDFSAYTPKRSLRQRLAEAFNVKVPMPGHSYGMVGFLKQLVDEQAAHDVTRRNRSGTTQRVSKFKSVTFAPSIVFIRKV